MLLSVYYYIIIAYIGSEAGRSSLVYFRGDIFFYDHFRFKLLTV